LMFRPVNPALNPVTVQLDADGRYEAAVPAGECKISVDNRGLLNQSSGPVGVGGAPKSLGGRGGPPGAVAPPPGAMGDMIKDKGVPEVAGAKQAGTYVQIPKEYYDPETSGLTLTVKRGNQTYDIDLVLKK
jgi:hypothetical protein